jgi:hypothetical protein
VVAVVGPRADADHEVGGKAATQPRRPGASCPAAGASWEREEETWRLPLLTRLLSRLCSLFYLLSWNFRLFPSAVPFTFLGPPLSQPHKGSKCKRWIKWEQVRPSRSVKKLVPKSVTFSRVTLSARLGDRESTEHGEIFSPDYISL